MYSSSTCIRNIHEVINHQPATPHTSHRRYHLLLHSKYSYFARGLILHCNTTRFGRFLHARYATYSLICCLAAWCPSRTSTQQTDKILVSMINTQGSLDTATDSILAAAVCVYMLVQYASPGSFDSPTDATSHFIFKSQLPTALGCGLFRSIRIPLKCIGANSERSPKKVGLVVAVAAYVSCCSC